MAFDTSALTTQLASLKGGSAYYFAELGPKPKITVKGLGELTFPLNAIQVRALLDKAHVAPFGKGHQTLVDPTVRNTWEIDAEQINLTDASFRKSLKAFLAAAATELNIEGGIKAEPYKLLIYEKEGFFAEHQDSEKLPGMFGTLLVGLPSAHAGGRLLIDPGNGERVAVEFAKNNAANFPAVAFFADRKHEIEPVTKGFRVVMVFNLVQANGGKPAKIDQTAAAQALAQTLSGFTVTDAPLCLALGHQYTDTNFSTGQLKGNDAIRIAVLRQAAALAGLEIRVGLIEHHTSAEWENADQFGMGYGYSYGSRRSRYGYDDFSSRGEPKTFAQVEVGEFHEGHLIMSNWLPEDGPGVGQLNLDEEDIVLSPDRPEEEPIDWSVEGYQGNWGMMTEFTYRHAGVLLWHPAATDQIVAKLPLKERLEWLMAQLEKKGDELVAHPQLVRVLTTLAETLQGNRYATMSYEVVAKLLLHFGKANPTDNEAVFAPWIEVFVRDFEKTKPDFWPQAVKVFGVNSVGRVFRQLTENGKKLSYRAVDEQPPQVLAAVQALLTSKERDSLTLGEVYLNRLTDYLLDLPERARTGAEYVAALLQLAGQRPEHKMWADSALVNKLLPSLHEPLWIRKTLAPALLKEMNRGGSFLLTGLLEDLKARTAVPPQPYIDFARPLPEKMEKPSGQFQEVMVFLQDPTKETFDFKRSQSERDALSGYLKRYELDVKQTTIRTHPSHTLRLTKTNASFQRRTEQYATDLKLYQQLVKLSNDTAGLPSASTAADFVRHLRDTALHSGYSAQDVKTALKCYHAYFVNQTTGQVAAPQAMNEVTDHLLDTWEDQLTKRYTDGTDDALVPKSFPSLAAVWAAAFGEVVEG